MSAQPASAQPSAIPDDGLRDLDIQLAAAEVVEEERGLAPVVMIR